jgi:hypothetical protein
MPAVHSNLATSGRLFDCPRRTVHGRLDGPAALQNPRR